METGFQSSEIRLPKNPNSPSTNVGPTFKSSFARSLSFCTNQQKPLDLEISFRIAQSSSDSSIRSSDSSSSSTSSKHQPIGLDGVDDIEDDFDEFLHNSSLKHSMRNLNISNASSTTSTPTRNGVLTGLSPLCAARKRLQVIYKCTQTKRLK